ncbi:hypothetical protein CY0110_16917 [Crocosphaera chwakensis CCY0110]|uniref:Uncharacterized protein n=1 Tax=Crocosphaera chwakensis CCY0110 TaxID=391612 RepID=A3II65_9CHRO|nr:hypothetical protein CY0110_16917 [Crocosphaera chwakensis CCY0110]
MRETSAKKRSSWPRSLSCSVTRYSGNILY